MNEFVYKLTLDLNCAKTPPVICSGQFDRGRKFEFTITANGEPYDVTGCSAVLKGVRTDGSHFAVECTVSDGKIIKILDDTTLSVRGKTVAKLVISDSEKSYSTQIFIIDVDSALDGDITIADDYSILNRLIEQIHALNESGAIIIDDTIDKNSTNAVANSAVATALANKPDRATTLEDYGITDGENLSNKVSAIDFQNLSATDYPNIKALYNYHTNYVEPCYDEIDNKADKATVDTALSGKLDNTAGSVTTDNIANKAVTSDKIATGAITALKLAPDAVRSTNIAQNQISTNHLQSGAVTTEKLADKVKTSINGKADKATTYTKTEVDEKSNNNVQEQINMLPKFLDMPVNVTSRALCVDGTSLFHSGTASYTVGGVKHMYATSKVDVKTETNPAFIGKTGGHDKCYPRNMAIGNGYLYVPYRDSKSGELSSFGADTDIGGYLDIIGLSDFTLEENSITYSREPYKITTIVDGEEKEVTRYFGKSHFVATYNDSLLCVTQQMGGWKLYDISTTPENPTLLYSYDNRADIYIDNAEKGGYADFQQPAFFEDTNGNIYLAISGYDRDLLMIYDLSEPSNPQEVFGFHCGNNQLNLRTVPENGSLTTPYIHTLGLACAYPYIYCTIAPHPSYLNDTEKAFEGVIVADVSDITNVTTTVFKMPNEDRALYDTGEPSPTSIAVNSKHLIMDNADKGISVWSLKNPAEPKYLGCLNTGTPVCSVYMTKDGRTFAGTAVGEKYVGLSGSMTMYRGL